MITDFVAACLLNFVDNDVKTRCRLDTKIKTILNGYLRLCFFVNKIKKKKSSKKLVIRSFKVRTRRNLSLQSLLTLVSIQGKTCSSGKFCSEILNFR